MTLLDEPIEKLISTKLPTELGQQAADDLLTIYSTSVTQLRSDIWPNIAAAEPNLTYHGESHIRAVLRNSFLLIDSADYAAIDLYVLAMMALFHDVGNLDGRRDHHLKIVQIYDAIHPPNKSDAALKNVVLRGCMAHCGYASDGSKDTLAEIGPDPYPLHYSGVQLQDVAAVLRFADEMSEDPRRTSRYMLNHDKYAIDSEIHHWYSTVTGPYLEPTAGRAILHYNIHAPSQGSDESQAFLDKLEERLTYIMARIRKLDLERRYNAFYSSAVREITRTEFSIYVHFDGSSIPLQEKPFVISDLIAPDADVPRISDRWPELKPSALSLRIQKELLKHA